MKQNSRPRMDPRTEGIVHSIAGGGAVVLETLLNYPLDTLKTRYQLIKSTSCMESPSLHKLMSSMIKNEGLISLYRGLPSALAMQVPRGVVKFGTNYYIQHVSYNWLVRKEGVNSHVMNALSGLMTGIIDGIIVCPFEYVKVRMQSSDYRYTYRNCLQCLLEPRNYRHVWNGLECTLWRNGLWHMTYFGLLQRQKQSNDRFVKNKWHDFAIGCAGGGLGSVFSSPFDVCKSRIQNMPTQTLPKQQIPWALGMVYTLSRTEGVSSLYRGFVPKFLRLALGGGVLMLSFEYILNGFETVYWFTAGHVREPSF
ncbi:hypothetical protein RFI_36233 [Reticulomyxa filosa]|uniref:Mitochondrial carrier protein n=1 Tax=Reticulomyxa filosa TaxID=46433 RepID=X6LIK4_RETFI|nr:hypothetical protein RFI_36233 [Reticulomyxa filosa]|eukprot:ETO01206.1 hypothetical protein RFI_36233 [Reticulomyxa filosa]